MKTPEWFYDEMVCCGHDFTDPQHAAEYDRRHGQFRDFEQEARQTMDLLGLRPEHTLIDIGAGTGAFAVYAAPYCRKIHAVDIAPAMLEVCRQKCLSRRIQNVEFHHGGFLTYEHKAEPADAIISQVALHHLPDFWKQVGLIRCFEMLRPGGILYLMDVVFSFPVQTYRATVAEWVDKQSRNTGDGPMIHIKKEYSTMGWIMEGMLERAGFQIEKAEYRDGFFAWYLCRKPSA
jgi:ubiquinone/menaquinone biosynthesis C-methylase UbiE